MSEHLKELAALECANQFAANRSMAVDREWVRGWDACIDYVRAALSTDAASAAQVEPGSSDTDLLDFMQEFATACHNEGVKDCTFSVKTHFSVRDQLNADRKKLEHACAASPATMDCAQAEPALKGGKTGAPPGMLQDDSRELSRALASKPDARMHAREAAQGMRAIEQDFPGVGCACNGDCDETGVCPLLGVKVCAPRAQRTLDALMAGDKEALPVELHEYVDALYWHRRVRMLRAAGLPPHKEPS